MRNSFRYPRRAFAKVILMTSPSRRNRPTTVPSPSPATRTDRRSRAVALLIACLGCVAATEAAAQEESELPRLFARPVAARPLPVDEADTFLLGQLPPLHQDPFDRLLICQAIARQAVLLTPDPLIAQYPVAVRW